MANRKPSKADLLLVDAIALLSGIQEFKQTEEYKALESHMTAVCHSLGVLAIKAITKERNIVKP